MELRHIAYPRQTVLITSEAEVTLMGKKVEKKNIMTMSWSMPVSFEPWMYAIAVNDECLSLELIRKSKVFCVNFMPIELKNNVLYCGRNSGRTKDKFKETGLKEEECEKIHCPRIKKALAYLECEVAEEIKAGDHFVFIGNVVNAKIKKEGNRVFHKGGDKFTTTID
ncbi:MAG: flavin reductase family protein [Candidatus Woesearchaeota archaeon]|nr:flavin reductase family protein [Candidatus Woesearchaeota archaeon]